MNYDYGKFKMSLWDFGVTDQPDCVLNFVLEYLCNGLSIDINKLRILHVRLL